MKTLIATMIWISVGAAMANEKPAFEKVDSYVLIPLPVEGFEDLSLNNKLLAYHLVQAAIVGRDIFFEQNYKYNLPIRKLCEQIVLHPKGVDKSVLGDIETYLKFQFLNGGIHSQQTFQKFTPSKHLTFEKLKAATQVAIKNGASIETSPIADNLDRFLHILDPIIFDPKVDEWGTTRSPDKGQDVLQASAISFYDPGIKLSDLEGFKERYPMNSTIGRVGGILKEQVWRAGNKTVQSGLYADRLAKVISQLKAAIPFASKSNALSLMKLIEFYETGENKTFDDYNIAWLKYDKPVVDQIQGFVESYRDPLEKKASWEGVVFFVNEKTSGWLRKVAAKADYYEKQTPFDPAYKRKGVKPISNMVEVLVETGDGGPISAAGVNLPNDQQIRQKYGSKNVLLWNAKRGKDLVGGNKLLEEFVWPDDQRIVVKHKDQTSEILVGFHETLGHASGKASKKLKGDPRDHLPGYYAWLEEERADLLALHHAWDPETFKIREDWSAEAARSLYKKYVATQLASLALLPEGASIIEESHLVGENFAVNYFIQKGAVEVVKKRIGGREKTFYVVSDSNIPKMREVVAELLAELQRIKAEGDLEAIKKLAEQYNATKVDPKLVQEIKERKKALNIPDHYAFIYPTLELVEKEGKVVDVTLKPETNFLQQQLSWGIQGTHD